MHIVEKQ